MQIKIRLAPWLALVTAFSLSACSSNSTGVGSSVGGSAGATSTGGAGAGGESAIGGGSSGGAASPSGGTTNSETATDVGGSSPSGGSSAALPTGGRPATGGSPGSGGRSSSGGNGGSNSGGNGGSSGGGGSGGSSGGSSSNSGGSSGTAQVRWIGRIDTSNAAAVKFAWSGTGFVANVEGTKISVKLQSESSAAFFQPVIDGTVGKRFQVASGSTQTVVLASALTAGTHKVELYRETEGSGYGDTVFQGFVDGTLVAPPPAPGRLIEIIGDSISAGYGNLGTNPCSFTIDTESAYQSYGWQLGRLLSADVSIIACSGWGMYKAYGGSTTSVMSSVYGNTLGTQASPLWNFAQKPDAVLINLGTNDSSSSDPLKPYEDAYVAFLKTVRSHYPNAWIFLTMGPMTDDPLLTTMRTHITNVITTLGDSKVVQVNLAVQDTTIVGCDWHPTVAEDTIMANALKTALATKLGW